MNEKETPFTESTQKSLTHMGNSRWNKYFGRLWILPPNETCISDTIEQRWKITMNSPRNMMIWKKNRILRQTRRIYKNIINPGHCWSWTTYQSLIPSSRQRWSWHRHWTFLCHPLSLIKTDLLSSYIFRSHKQWWLSSYLVEILFMEPWRNSTQSVSNIYIYTNIININGE